MFAGSSGSARFADSGFAFLFVMIFLPLILGGSAPGSGPPITTIALGSCANQDEPQPIWGAVNATRPDLFVFLGDNIYADTTDPAVLRAKYDRLAAQPGFRQLRRHSEVVAIWDDHDYAFNDVGSENPIRVVSRRIFLSFWREPWWTARHRQGGGVYTSYLYGPPGRRVQLILLDTRWSRTPYSLMEAAANGPGAAANGPGAAANGPGAAANGPGAAGEQVVPILLGEVQWRWFEKQLDVPADLRIIATSIPILQDGPDWDVWETFPVEYARMRWLLARKGIEGALFISGDTHYSQILRRHDDGMPYAFWELNASGLTENAGSIPPDRHRVGPAFGEDNYGLIQIDWQQEDPSVTLQIRDVHNRTVLEQELHLSDLSLR